MHGNNGSAGRLPITGRFTQLDPMQFKAGDPNLYRYTANDSLNSVDPSGMIVGTPIGVLLGGVVGAAGGAGYEFMMLMLYNDPIDASTIIGGAAMGAMCGLIGVPPALNVTVPALLSLETLSACVTVGYMSFAVGLLVSIGQTALGFGPELNIDNKQIIRLGGTTSIPQYIYTIGDMWSALSEWTIQSIRGSDGQPQAYHGTDSPAWILPAVQHPQAPTLPADDEDGCLDPEFETRSSVSEPVHGTLAGSLAVGWLRRMPRSGDVSYSVATTIHEFAGKPPTARRLWWDEHLQRPATTSRNTGLKWVNYSAFFRRDVVTDLGRRPRHWDGLAEGGPGGRHKSGSIERMSRRNFP